MAEGVFSCSKFRIFDLISIIVVGCNSSFNALRCYAGSFWSFLDCNGKDFYTFRHILCIPFVDFGMSDNSEDCIREVVDSSFYLVPITKTRVE